MSGMVIWPEWHVLDRIQEQRHAVSMPRKVDVRLPGKENSNSHGARPLHLIITMIRWIRTSRLSIKNSLSLVSMRLEFLTCRADLKKSCGPLPDWLSRSSWILNSGINGGHIRVCPQSFGNYSIPVGGLIKTGAQRRKLF